MNMAKEIKDQKILFGEKKGRLFEKFSFCVKNGKKKNVDQIINCATSGPRFSLNFTLFFGLFFKR